MMIRSEFMLPPAAEGTGAGGAEGGGAGGGGGGAAAGGAAWYESKDLGLEDDVKTFIAGKRTPDLKTGIKSWMEADNAARARNVLERPDPKNVAAWKGWSELGWVEDPAKYEIKPPDQKAVKFPYNADIMGALKTAGHQNRVPLPAAQAMHDAVLQAYGKYYDDLEAKGANATAELQAALDTAWGADKPRNLELAKRAAKAFGVGAEDMSELEKVITSPRLLKMFHSIGARLGEDKLVDGGSGGGVPSSMAELRAELNRLQGDKEFMKALNEVRHPQHKDKVAQRQAIINKIAALELKKAG